MNAKHVIYEVDLEIDPAIVADYDVWLEHHLREVLDVEGFEIGRVLKPEGVAAPDGWVRRVCHYTVRSRHDLQRYFDGPAAAMRQKGIDRFGDRFRATRRVLDPVQELATPATYRGGDGSATACPNCGSTLNDRFCARCGQENKATVMAFHRIVADFLGDLFNFDSRLFNSLWPLVAKPGLLTREYVAGRRARFIPPVRMYLFMSLFFFGIATFGVPDDLFKDDPDTGRETAAEVDEALAKQGYEDGKKRNRPRISVAPQGDRDPVEAPTTDEGQSEGWGVRVDDNDDTQVNFTDDDAGFLYEAEKRAERNVRRLKKDEEFRGEMIRRGIGNVPLMMFVLLPVYALILKLLYVRSGRYYVEHLIYSLHLHSFIFLAAGGSIAWALVIDQFGYEPAPPWWLTTAFWAYFTLYPFFAMRTTYGQGRFKTALKYLLLGLVYFVLLACGIVGVLFYTLAT